MSQEKAPPDGEVVPTTSNEPAATPTPPTRPPEAPAIQVVDAEEHRRRNEEHLRRLLEDAERAKAGDPKER